MAIPTFIIVCVVPQRYAYMNYVFNCLFVIVWFELNVCMCVFAHSCLSSVCMLAHFATNYIPSKQLNEQVNEVNSS